jgi:hypothetical protein
MGAADRALFFVPVIGGIGGAAIGANGRTENEAIRFRPPLERFHGVHFKLVDTNLTDEEREVLLETFDSAR